MVFVFEMARYQIAEQLNARVALEAKQLEAGATIDVLSIERLETLSCDFEDEIGQGLRGCAFLGNW